MSLRSSFTLHSSSRHVTFVLRSSFFVLRSSLFALPLFSLATPRSLATHPNGITHISLNFSGVNENATLLPNSAGVANDTSTEKRDRGSESARRYAVRGRLERFGLTEHVDFSLGLFIEDASRGEDVPYHTEKYDLYNGLRGCQPSPACGGRKEEQVPLRRSIVASSLHSVSLVCLWERGAYLEDLRGRLGRAEDRGRRPLLDVVVVKRKKGIEGEEREMNQV